MSVILDRQNSDDDDLKQLCDEQNNPHDHYPFISNLWSPFWCWTDIPIPLCDLILNACKKAKGEEYHSSGIIPVSYTHLTLPTIYSV